MDSWVGMVVFDELSSGHFLGHSVELSLEVFLDLVGELRYRKDYFENLVVFSQCVFIE